MRPIDADRLKTVLEKNYGYTGVASVLTRLVDKQPTIQPEPHKGHWIRYNKKYSWRTYYECSECKNYLDFSGVNGGRVEPHFCPNCGARMEGEPNE